MHAHKLQSDNHQPVTSIAKNIGCQREKTQTRLAQDRVLARILQFLQRSLAALIVLPICLWFLLFLPTARSSLLLRGLLNVSDGALRNLHRLRQSTPAQHIRTLTGLPTEGGKKRTKSGRRATHAAGDLREDGEAPPSPTAGRLLGGLALLTTCSGRRQHWRRRRLVGHDAWRRGHSSLGSGGSNTASLLVTPTTWSLERRDACRRHRARRVGPITLRPRLCFYQSAHDFVSRPSLFILRSFLGRADFVLIHIKNP